MKKVILLYGPRKGGTTLLQRMIDNRDGLVLSSETKIKYFNEFIEMSAASSANSDVDLNDQLLRYFPVRLPKRIGFDLDLYHHELINNFSSVKCLSDYIDLHIAAHLRGLGLLSNSFEYFVIKEVGGNCKEIIGRFLDSYPNGLVVSITRDHKWVSRAVYNDRRRKKIKQNCKSKLFESIDPVNVSHCQTSFQGNSRVLTIAFSGLTQDPKSTMREVFSFIGEDLSEENCYPTMYGNRTIVATSSRNTDRVFVSNEKIWVGLSFVECFFILVSPISSFLYRLVRFVRIK